MNRLPSFLRRLAPAGLAIACAAGCATSKAPGKPAAPPGRPAAAGAAVAPGVLPLPVEAAPSGTLYRVGLRSDLPQFSFGTPGSPWILVSAGREERLRAPLNFTTEAGGMSHTAVQAGAFSQEETARAIAEKLSRQFSVTAVIAFSAEKGVYRVLLGDFASRSDAEALVERLKTLGQEAFVAAASGGAAEAKVFLTDEEGSTRRYASPVDVFPAVPEERVAVGTEAYRGSLRVLVNPRGTLNVVNRLDLEEYLYGVVPAEMGPRRYDELEALKAQAVAARTYAFAHRGQFEAEGYDLCATPKCQVYAGLGAEDPLSSAAVDATRGLVLAWQGHFADALFVSTCGGRTENVENVFAGGPVPYLVSVACGELDTTRVEGARLPRGEKRRPRSALEWRGWVLRRRAPKSRAPRAAALATAQAWAGVERRGSLPSSLSPAAVYPSLVAAFGLKRAVKLHLTPQGVAYASEAPAASGSLSGRARDAYDFLVRLRFGAGESLPPADRRLNEEEYAGLLFSAALRLAGVTEGSGRFLSREGSHLWVKTAGGRASLPVDPDLPLARRVGEAFFVSPSLTLRAGDRLRWWVRQGQYLALWVELDPAGPTFERGSAWTEWVRRVSGRELARRLNGRVPGSEVREITVTRRSLSGRAIEVRVTTEAGEVTLERFDLRQALGLPEMLFSVERVSGPQGEPEFVFLGRGWGHGVGMCQNGAYGMALAGKTYDQILRHYYTRIDILPASGVTAAPPSTR